MNKLDRMSDKEFAELLNDIRTFLSNKIPNVSGKAATKIFEINVSLDNIMFKDFNHTPKLGGESEIQQIIGKAEKPNYQECVNCGHDINSHYGKNESDEIEQCHRPKDESYEQCKCINPQTKLESLQQQIKQLQEERDNYVERKIYWEHAYSEEQHKNQQLKEKLEKALTEINLSIESYEELNKKHQENFEKTQDTSLLATISRNQDIIDELNPIKQILDSTPGGSQT